jgi:hypothetical protein
LGRAGLACRAHSRGIVHDRPPVADKDRRMPAPSPPSRGAFSAAVCGLLLSGAAAMPAAAAPAADPAAERKVRAATEAYLAAKDAGDFAKARAMATEEAKPYLDSDNWSEPRAEFNRGAGQPKQRRVVRLTWYDNPQGAVRAGRYVAADYRGDYAHAGFYCGYVVWLEEPDGSYRVMREEETQIPAQMAAKFDPVRMAQTRKQVGCRD